MNNQQRRIEITDAIAAASPAMVSSWTLSKAERRFAKWHFWRNGVLNGNRTEVKSYFWIEKNYVEPTEPAEDGVMAAEYEDDKALYEWACNRIGALGTADQTKLLRWSLEGTTDAEILDYIEECIWLLETERHAGY